MKTLKAQAEDQDIFQHRELDPEDDPFAKPSDDSDSDSAPSEAGITGREHYEEVLKSKLRRPEQPVLGKRYNGAIMSRKTLFDDNGSVQEAEGEDAEDYDEDGLVRADSRSSVSSVKSNEVPSSDFEKLDEAANKDLRAEVFVYEDDIISDLQTDDGEGSGSDDGESLESNDFTIPGSQTHLDPVNSREVRDLKMDEIPIWDIENEERIESDQNMDTDDADSDSNAESQALYGKSSGSDTDSNTSPEPPTSTKAVTDREEVKKMLMDEAAAVTSTLSASANADAQKGRAVKQQYHTFDRLLDVRIKLQKGLMSASSISLPTNPEADVSTAAKAAEAAAMNLFSTIESIRLSMSEAVSEATGKKRKRAVPPTSSSTSTKVLWTRLSEMEEQSLSHRRTILNKWSRKTQSGKETFAPRSKLDRGTHRDTITDILDAQVVSECTKTLPTDAYNDTAFYQSLLHDLISSRASLSESANTISNIPIPQAPKQHRKGVDTKASKGRKVRYTVHEKLQNFFAEEDRGTWTESAKAEFFASLFGGQGKVLDEDEAVRGMNGDTDDEMLGEEGALRLFRN